MMSSNRLISLSSVFVFVGISLVLLMLMSLRNLSINMCGNDLIKINDNMTLEICNDTFNIKFAGGGEISVNLPTFEALILNASDVN